MITGIPLIDSILEIFPWSKSEEYKKLEEQFGEKVKQIVVELILLPIVKYESVNDMAHAIGRHPNEYYDVLKKAKIDWLRLLREFTWYFFLTMLRVYRKNSDPSHKSRWRIHIAIDDTQLRRWSRKIAGSHCLYNYVNKHYMYGQNILCLAVIIGKNKLVFPLLCEISDPRCFVVRRSKIQKVCEALRALHQAAQEEELSLEGVRLISDSGFACGEVMQTAKDTQLAFFTTAKSIWTFTLEDGSEVTCADLQKGAFPKGTKPRQASRVGCLYYRFYATHPTLGKLVLCVYACKRGKRSKYQKYWVYVSSNTDIDCITIYQEHKIRWKIESMFRLFKQALGFHFYQGIARIGHNAWFALTCLRFLLIQLAFKKAARFPSLRWNVRKKRFTFSFFVRYFRDNYHMDSKLLKIKRLHYSIAS